jgi:hypothetical protein
MDYKMLVKDDYHPVPFTIKLQQHPEATPLYSKPQELKPEKKRHLLELLPSMPPAKRPFYEKLLGATIEDRD